MPQYNGVWTLEAAAQAQSNQQWVTDPNFRNTTLLLQADGTVGGAQNNTFLDSSSNAFAIARTGTPTQGSFTPFSEAPGNWSTFFNGSNQKIAGVAGANFAYGTGAFTVEAFVFTTGSASGQIIFNQAVSGTNYFIFQISSNKLEFVYATSGGGTIVSSTSNVPLNTWTHVAAVRQGTGSNQFALYINGVNVVTSTVAQDFTNTTYSPTIGDYTHSTLLPFAGYISNLRVIKGQALFTGNFTPSTTPLTSTSVGATGSGAATSISGTVSLLAMQSNRFVDNGATGMTLTPTGTPSVQAFGPFAPQFQWTEPVIGGAAYFAGTGNYLLPTANALFAPGNTGAWTFEAFVYIPTTTSGYIYAVGNGASFGNSMLCSWGSNTFSFAQGSGSSNPVSISSAANFPPFAWYHYAVVKNASNLITMYINGVQVGTPVTYTAGIATGTTPVINGGYDNNGLGNNGLNCYTSNLRWIKGTAVYSGTSTTAPNFVVPTAPLTATMGANPFGGSNTAAATATFLANFTNAGIYDGTMNNNVTTVSTAQVNTSIVKYGSGSIAFNGSSTSLTFPDTSKYNLFNLGTGDFTIEFWFYLLNTTTNFIYTRTVSGTNALAIGAGANATDKLFFVAAASGGGTNITSSGIPSANVWQHAAVVKQNGYVTVYLNGIGGTPTLNTVSLDLTYVPTIGSYTHVFTSALNGYLDDFRITKGVARYTANFIPPLVALPRQ